MAEQVLQHSEFESKNEVPVTSMKCENQAENIDSNLNEVGEMKEGKLQNQQLQDAHVNPETG